ncbi:MAG: hypothetical protein IT373_33870 [Polyangiaceae bacterium]|nr:hypothetical protein [Polyangiaceae bacterium]
MLARRQLVRSQSLVPGRRKRVIEDLCFVRDSAPAIDPDEPVGPQLWGAMRTLAEGAALLGPGALRIFLAPLAGLAPAVVRDLAGRPAGHRTEPELCLHLLSFLELCRLGGFALPAGSARAEQAALLELGRRARALDEAEHLEALLLALAGGALEALPGLVFGRRPPHPAPGAEPLRDAASFARLLAIAVLTKAPPPEVLPAWRRFVGAFPAAVGPGLLHWGHLVHAATSYYRHLEGCPLAEVVPALHALVVSARS